MAAGIWVGQHSGRKAWGVQCVLWGGHVRVSVYIEVCQGFCVALCTGFSCLLGSANIITKARNYETHAQIEKDLTSPAFPAQFHIAGFNRHHHAATKIRRAKRQPEAHKQCISWTTGYCSLRLLRAEECTPNRSRQLVQTAQVWVSVIDMPLVSSITRSSPKHIEHNTNP